MSRFLIAFLLLFWAAPEASAVYSDPYRIMHAHYNAIGGLEKLKEIKTSYAEGATRLDGLKGTFKHWEKPPLQRRTEENYTALVQIEGDTGQIAWLLDTNGQLLLYKDEETVKRRIIAQKLADYEHLDPASTFFSLLLTGTTDILQQKCYEIVLTNTINSDISKFYIDITSLLLVQSIIKQPDMKLVTNYDDYRWVDDFFVSFYQHTLYLPWEREEETQITKYTINEQIADDLFTLPEKKRGFNFLSGKDSATTSFLLAENLIYLPVIIDGRQLNWVLDSGASMSVIDYDYAKRMGLDVKGSIKGYGFGDLFELSFVDVPEYQVGDIVFNSQTFYAIKGLTARSYEPEIAGILGYDFLSRFVVEINYDHNLVTFHDPDMYSYKGEGVILDAPLKYRTFTVDIVLDNRFKGKWSIDLGAHRSSVHFPFAKKNNLLERTGIETISQGVSGISYEKTAQFDCLTIGGFQLNHPLIAIPLEKGKGVTALGEIAGNLGNSTLRHFNLVLNYPEQKIIISRGKNFDTIFPRDKSGMLIGRSEENQPMISFVARKSPAQKSGFIAGDIILQVNGHEIQAGHKVLLLRDLLRESTTSSHTFLVDREGTVHKLVLELQDLFPQGSPTCQTAAGSR